MRRPQQVERRECRMEEDGFGFTEKLARMGTPQMKRKINLVSKYFSASNLSLFLFRSVCGSKVEL